jgi:hypothetical protein
LSRRLRSTGVVLALQAVAVMTLVGCAGRMSPEERREASSRRDDIARARVWTPVRTEALDLWSGPPGPQAFSPAALVVCDYVEKDMSGSTPKFSCRLPTGDVVKVKFGQDNGEVYAEVAATRLLWALGFGADRMYPVKVLCHGCPEDGVGAPVEATIRRYDIAVIERKLPGYEIDGPGGEGWAWPELDTVDPERGGASRAHRDALKLLAAFIQHTDSKREQQRLLCLDPRKTARCRHPFMMINDLGKTFGRANAFNRDGVSSVNLKAWSDMSVWADTPGCRANIPKSLTGTLDNPSISEAGRAFLAARLSRLTDAQVRDMFAVARFPARDRAAGDAAGHEVAEWVAAFKAKVRAVRERSCVAARAAR